MVGSRHHFESDRYIVRFPSILTVEVTDKLSGKTGRGTGLLAVKIQSACFSSDDPDAAICEVMKVLAAPHSC